MTKHLALFLLLATLGSSAGCGWSLPWMRRPGPEPYQQLRATRFDPYPDVNAGPPVVGGRPLQYQVPRSEPTRSQWALDAIR